jgi:hypothetical protein
MERGHHVHRWKLWACHPNLCIEFPDGLSYIRRTGAAVEVVPLAARQASYLFSQSE